MTQPRARRQWAIVGASGFLTGIGHGFVQIAASAILKPLAAEFDLSRAGASGAMSLGRLVQGGTSLVAGHAVDIWGGRIVVVIGTVVMAAGLLLTALAGASLGFYLSWGLVVSAGASLAFTVAMDRTILANVVKRRGFALSVRFTVVALVTALQLPLILWLVTNFGWRATCAVWSGLLILLVPLPLLLFEGARAVPSDNTGGRSLTLRRAMKTRAYWIIGFASMSMGMTVSGISVHSIPMLTDRGWTIAGAGGVVATLTLLTIPARLLTGVFSDWLAARHLPGILGVVLLAFGLTVAADAAIGTDASLVAMMMAMGIATGVPTVMILVISVTRFGQESIGAIQGSFMFLQAPGTVAAPVIAGWAHDGTGTYAPAIAIFAGFLATAGIALQFLTTGET